VYRSPRYPGIEGQREADREGKRPKVDFNVTAARSDCEKYVNSVSTPLVDAHSPAEKTPRAVRGANEVV
jgi:hypothetical protein